MKSRITEQHRALAHTARDALRITHHHDPVGWREYAVGDQRVVPVKPNLYQLTDAYLAHHGPFDTALSIEAHATHFTIRGTMHKLTWRAWLAKHLQKVRTLPANQAGDAEHEQALVAHTDTSPWRPGTAEARITARTTAAGFKTEKDPS